MVFTHTFDICPVPASRPRVSKWSTYYGKKYTQFKKDMKYLVGDLPIFEGNLKLDATFYVKAPKAMKLKGDGDYCTKNDIDNYCKSVMDSLNGYLYIDDRQVVELSARKKWS